MSGPEGTGQGQPTPEQLVAELQKARVGDFLVHTCSLLASLGYGKLAPETRDLDDARLAVEALRVLQPLLPEQVAREMKNVVAGLQLAYAEAAAGGAEEEPEPKQEPEPEQEPEP